MAAVLRTALRWRDRLVALSVLDQDALLYVLAAILAFGTILLGESADYRQWAEMALGPYALARCHLLGGRAAALPSGQEERDPGAARWPAQRASSSLLFVTRRAGAARVSRWCCGPITTRATRCKTK